uniref:efflux transporter outer membrane subunit n=1 Tax=Paraburkholderia sp. TaxID=1926495 RepID=UPI00286ED1D5
LVNNRDLRVAALNIDAYRAQYRIQRADLFPAVSATGSGSRQRVPANMSQSGEAGITSQYSATLGVSAYELDLFGRVRSLTEQALETYLSSEQARRSTQIALVASVANAYYTWQADQALLKLTQDTLKAYEESYNLTRRSNEVGVASALDVSQARTAVEGARVKYSQYQRLVAQDANSLAVLLGTGIPSNLPQPLELGADQLAEVPAGLPSDILQRRPDIQEAEHLLKAANANIGAARAAFFPSISLTGQFGYASASLGSLFKPGQLAWDFGPTITMPIFEGGANKASLDVAKLEKDEDVASYEKAIQTAFREVADGLAARGTYDSQISDLRAYTESEQRRYTLSDLRYRNGVDSYLSVLSAQTDLYSAQQSLISANLSRLTNLVDLYQYLGGGWVAQTGDAPRNADSDRTAMETSRAAVPASAATAVR